MNNKWLLAIFIALLTLSMSPRSQAAIPVCFVAANGPTGLAVDTAHSSIWVANWNGGTVSEVDQVGCGIIRSVHVGVNPDGVAIGGNNVWVANFGSNTVTEINSTTGAVINTFAVGSGPRGVAIDNQGKVWVSNYNSNTVTVLNGGPIVTHTTGSGPYFLTFNSTDGNVYVPNRNSNTVTVINSVSGVTVRTVPVPTEPQFATSNGVSVWVSSYSSAKISNISTSGVVTSGSAPHNSPTGISVQASTIYGAENSGWVFEMSTSTLVAGVTAQIGSTNYDCAWAFNTGTLWVTNFGGNQLIKVSVP